MEENVVIVVVDYRLAPEHNFPAPILDVSAVLERLALVSEIQLGLCGDSAGGGLVYSTLLHLRETTNLQQQQRIKAAVLVSPMLSQEHSDGTAHNQELDIIQGRLAHGTARNYCACPETAVRLYIRDRNDVMLNIVSVCELTRLQRDEELKSTSRKSFFG
jgi:acetyl esterase/lipase